MKKLFALLLAAMMLAASFAFAEDTSFSFEPGEELLANGAMDTIRVSSRTAFNMFVLNSWVREPEDTSWNQNIIAKWIAENGASILVGLGSPAFTGIDSLESMYEQLDSHGFIPSVFTMNGMEDVCLYATEDPLGVIGLGMMLPEGVFMITAGPFQSADQADEVWTMLHSLCLAEVEVLDVGVKPDELDMTAGALETVSINGMPVLQFYVYGDYAAEEPDASWESAHVFARWTNEAGRTLEARRIPAGEMSAANLVRYVGLMADSGYEGSLFNLNGVEALAYYTADTKATQGVCVIAYDGSAIVLTVSPIADDDQEAEAIQMLWSVRPGLDED